MNTRHRPLACWWINSCRTRGKELIGDEIDEQFVKDDHIELIQLYPCESPVMTKEDECSSTISFKGAASNFALIFTLAPSFAMLSGGKSPFCRGSSNRFKSSSVALVDRKLQCETVMVVVHKASRVSAKNEDDPK